MEMAMGCLLCSYQTEGNNSSSGVLTCAQFVNPARVRITRNNWASHVLDFKNVGSTCLLY